MVWVTFTTVGLGDIVIKQFDYTLLYVFLILIGLSSVSMCINILQDKIEEMMRRLQEKIEREYKEAVFIFLCTQLFWETFLKSKHFQLEKTDQEADENAGALKSRKKGSLVSNKGDKLLTMFMSRKDKKKMKQIVTRTSLQKHKMIQVDPADIAKGPRWK